MKNCENCGTEHDGSFGTGRFCSKFCSRSFSTKNKRKRINEQVSKALIGKKISEETKLKISANNYSRTERGRHARSKQQIEYFNCDSTDERQLRREKISKKLQNRTISESTRNKLSEKALERCSNIEERIRLSEIGRKGGFGTKGYTANGVFYQSNLEKICYEFLELNNIEFDAHKHLPDSSKMTDVYLPQSNLWIEIDGINREKRKKWLGKNYDSWIEKIEEYRSKNLNMRVVYCLSDLIDILKT